MQPPRLGRRSPNLGEADVGAASGEVLEAEGVDGPEGAGPSKPAGGHLCRCPGQQRTGEGVNESPPASPACRVGASTGAPRVGVCGGRGGVIEPD
jgi:hypothetical protein